MEQVVIDTMKKLIELTKQGSLRWHASMFWGTGYTTVYRNVVLRIQPDKLELSNAEGDVARFEIATCGSSITPYLADLHAGARRAISNYQSVQIKGLDNMMEGICQTILAEED
ncbi:MAG: hypothetical protein WAQ98_16925 [Blastocatellia bacterium]